MVLPLPILRRRKRGDLIPGSLWRLPVSPLFRATALARIADAYVIGMSGKGESKVLERCLYQDIAAGRGRGLVDPHSLIAVDLLRLPVTRSSNANPDIRNRWINCYPARQWA